MNSKDISIRREETGNGLFLLYRKDIVRLKCEGCSCKVKTLIYVHAIESGVQNIEKKRKNSLSNHRQLTIIKYYHEKIWGYM